MDDIDAIQRTAKVVALLEADVDFKLLQDDTDALARVLDMALANLADRMERSQNVIHPAPTSGLPVFLSTAAVDDFDRLAREYAERPYGPAPIGVSEVWQQLDAARSTLEAR